MKDEMNAKSAELAQKMQVNKQRLNAKESMTTACAGVTNKDPAYHTSDCLNFYVLGSTSTMGLSGLNY